LQDFGPGVPPWPADRGTSDRYPSDLADEKPGTDVLLVGTALPLAVGTATEFDIRLRVASDELLLDKRLVVYGPRVWQMGVLGVVPGPAGRAGPTELRWENAYGGLDDADPAKPFVEDRNPVGRGHVRDRARLIGHPAPPIEDPRAPLSARKPAPGGFGPIASWWQPRTSRGGTSDAAWRRERAPIRPIDFDPRFNAVTPDDQWLGRSLSGDEAVEVVGTDPQGPWRFRLPRFAPQFRYAIDSAEQECETHLDTFLIDADEHRVELTWRACVPLPRKTELLRFVRITGAETLPDEIIAELFARSRATPEAT
jgi:hypothetical protein